MNKLKLLTNRDIVHLILINIFAITIPLFNGVQRIRWINLHMFGVRIDNVIYESMIFAVILSIIYLLLFVIIRKTYKYIEGNWFMKTKEVIDYIVTDVFLTVIVYFILNEIFAFDKLMFGIRYDKGWPLALSTITVLTVLEIVINNEYSKVCNTKEKDIEDHMS